jgi:hypothetical protein
MRLYRFPPYLVPVDVSSKHAQGHFLRFNLKLLRNRHVYDVGRSIDQRGLDVESYAGVIIIISIIGDRTPGMQAAATSSSSRDGDVAATVSVAAVYHGVAAVDVAADVGAGRCAAVTHPRRSPPVVPRTSLNNKWLGNVSVIKTRKSAVRAACRKSAIPISANEISRTRRRRGDDFAKYANKQ